MTSEEFFKEYELSADKPTKTRRELSPAEILEAIEGHPYRHHLVEFVEDRKEVAFRLSESLAKSTVIDMEAAEALLFALLSMMCFRRTAKEELVKDSVVCMAELLPLKHSILFFSTLQREKIGIGRRAEDHETRQFTLYMLDCINEIIKTINEL